MPDSPPPIVEELRRLSLVRHLYRMGLAQSRGSEPTACFSILSFHDAAEAFLQLACEKYGAGENKADFMQYWNLLAAKGIDISERETMRRLNAARRGLKHQGILPAHVEIEGFRAATTNFLYNNSEMIFCISFEKISTVNLVSDSEIRQKLNDAIEALDRSDHKSSLEAAAVSFILVQRAYSLNQAQILPNYSPPTLKGAVRRSADASFALRDLEKVLGHSIRRLIEGYGHAFDILGEALDLLSQGHDLKDYLLFRAYLPRVVQFPGGSMSIQWMCEPTRDSHLVARCLDFVIDMAVRLRV